VKAQEGEHGFQHRMTGIFSDILDSEGIFAMSPDALPRECPRFCVFVLGSDDCMVTIQRTLDKQEVHRFGYIEKIHEPELNYEDRRILRCWKGQVADSLNARGIVGDGDMFLG